MSAVNEAQAHSDRAHKSWDDYEQTGVPAYLDDAIASFQDANAALSRTDPGRAKYLYGLLRVLQQRFYVSRDRVDLEEAIAAGREAISLDRGHSGYIVALSSLLLERFGSTGRQADLDEATELSRLGATRAPTRHVDAQNTLANLANAMETRFEILGSVADLEESIALHRSAVALSRPGPSRKNSLVRLATALHDLSKVTGRPEALSEAVRVARRAVKARPQEGRSVAYAHSVLGHVLMAQSERDGSVSDLDEAVECGGTAAESIPAGHPDLPLYLSRLIKALLLKAKLSGSTLPSAQALRLARDAAAVNGHNISLLIDALRTVYQLDGGLANLDEAIAVGHTELARLDRETPQWSNYAGALSSVLYLRFHHLKSMPDLDLAVRYSREVLETDFGGVRLRAGNLSDLGILLLARFSQTREPDDLHEAVSIAREAVAITVNSADRPVRLANLGYVLGDLYHHDGQLAHLNEAVGATREAIAAANPNTNNVARYHSNLAYLLTIRFAHTGNRSDLDDAIVTGRDSVSLVSSDSPERSKFLLNLGNALSTRYHLTYSPADRAEVVSTAIEAARAPTAPVLHRVSAARVAVDVMDRETDLCQAIDVLTEAVKILPQASPRRLLRGDRQRALGTARGLAADAASLVLADPRRTESERVRQALSLLETGRTVLVGQALDGRADVAELGAEHPDLASRFTKLRDQLDDADRYDSASPGTEFGGHSTRGPTAVHEGRVGLAADYIDVLASIRNLAGFESFGLPPDPDELLDAAQDGPVAVLNVSAYGSHALLVTSEGVSAVPLPELNQSLLADKVDAFAAARRSVVMGIDADQWAKGEADLTRILEWLWDVAAEPVLDALGFRHRPSKPDEWPRIWWVPCGLMSMLPIHAAGHHSTGTVDSSPRTVLDRAVSSYAPSLRTLIHTRRRSAIPIATSDPRVMAVTMPTTPGLPGSGRLPHVIEETKVLRRHFAELTVLGPQSTPGVVAPPVKEAVLARLAEHSIVHFACHGLGDPADPSRSRLLLDDHAQDPFTVASLAPVDIDRAQLAYLSACDTAAARSVKLLDESIHLASAFQVAGFPNVISTLWEIEDRLSVEIADAFYTNLRAVDGAVETHRAAHALHAAVVAARDRPLPDGRIENPFLWASYIHIGI